MQAKFPSLSQVLLSFHMCGITAVLSGQPAVPVLMTGLQRLEYRGYDSAGCAVLGQDGQINIRKAVGKVANLKARSSDVEGSIGVAHTRWATHGPPNEVNAHPHAASDGSFALVHNGIIENYSVLKSMLQGKGYVFLSETDTEVLVHLLSFVHKELSAAAAPKHTSLSDAIPVALLQIVGTYGIAIVSGEDGGTLFAARMGSPLILGVGESSFHIASDATAFMDITRTSIVLEDGQWAQVKRGDKMFSIRNMQQEEQAVTLETIIGDVSLVEKGGFDHHMIKEITRQPDSLSNCLRGRVSAEGRVFLGGLCAVITHNGRQIVPLDAIRAARQITICACGTSWHAALVGEYLLETLANIRVEVEYASEFRYRSAPMNKDDDVVIVISQSGETADTLAALRMAKSKGVLVIGVCNVVGSTIARETDAGVYLHAGPEIGVASTKAFTAQVAVLSMIAISIGVSNGTTSAEEGEELGRALLRIPAAVEQCIAGCSSICKQVALEYWLAENFLFLGRAIHYPVALEGALKLKEISYIHAEGLPAAEMKHGHIALVDNRMPVVVIAQKDSKIFEKIVSNIQEVQARGGRVICVCSEAGDSLQRLCEHVILVPSVHPLLDALITVVPLQLIAYHIAVKRGSDVDQPRNLAKSVTVE